MRYEPLRRQVVLELAIVAAVLVVLMAIVYLLASIRDDYIENNTSAKRVIDGIQGEFNTLKQKYSFIQQNSVLYEEVKKKQEAGLLSINRPMILEKFNAYKLQYDLNNLRLSVSPIQDMKDPAYIRKTHAVSTAEVSVDLDTLSDERVFELMDVMQTELPGVCKINRITISRERNLDPDVVNMIRQKGTYPLIKTAFKFTWYSINALDTGAVAGVPAR
ncbi:MAG: hypothetical protein K2Q01_02545 [Rickettsiales bacterium]|nr:hypothetical protein [Rickettsiales bacterium]